MAGEFSPLNYIAPGGSSSHIKGHLTYGSSSRIKGTLTLVSTATLNGTLTLVAGSTMTVRGTLTLASSMTLKQATATPTTAANLPNSGVSLLTSTAANKTYVMDAPVAGVRKLIIATTPLAAATDAYVDLSTGISITTDSADRYLHFNAAEEAIELLGLSATRWKIISNVNAVAITTSTTG